MAIERTLGIIKPDAVAAGKMGEILSMISKAGFKIAAMKTAHLTREQAAEFYAVHAERPFFPDLIDFMTSGQIVAMTLEKENAVAAWRELMGPTDSTQAGPDTVRGRFGTSVSRNAGHGSDSQENAVKEILGVFPLCKVV